MFAVVRDNQFDPKKLASAGGLVEQFQAEHAAQSGYRGNLTIDAGKGRMLLVTLWESQSEAQAARSALEPAIRKFVMPLLAEPSHFAGSGEVVYDDVTTLEVATVGKR
jgi:hypothetical protein